MLPMRICPIKGISLACIFITFIKIKKAEIGHGEYLYLLVSRKSGLSLPPAKANMDVCT